MTAFMKEEDVSLSEMLKAAEAITSDATRDSALGKVIKAAVGLANYEFAIATAKEIRSSASKNSGLKGIARSAIAQGNFAFASQAAAEMPSSASSDAMKMEVVEARRHSAASTASRDTAETSGALDMLPPGGSSSAPNVPSNEMSHRNLILRLLSRFHVVAKQLTIRHDDRSTLEIGDEYDVQDLLHGLLKIHFDDVRPEEHSPSYAGGASRMDFLLKTEQTVIEVKKTRKSLGAKKLGDELLVDIARYRQHPNCQRLFCLVYDPDEIISNPAGLENDLSRVADGLEVTVVVCPRKDFVLES